MELVDKIRRKTVGLTNQEIAQEFLLILKSRFAPHYRYTKSLIINQEITDKKLEQSLSLLNEKDLLKYFQNRKNVKIYSGINNLIETCQIFQDNFPETTQKLIDEANLICEHKFSFLGKQLVYNQEIDWHYDPTIDYRWSSIHYSKMHIIAKKPGSDIKIPWELARLQHFITLGQAYHFTQDEKYALEFRNQLFSFARSSPKEIGIHWLCAMEVAFRAISLCLSFYFFRNSKHFDLDLLKLLLKLLLSHAEFIKSNLEFSIRITSNHYLSDLLGLFFIGVLFPEFKKSHTWTDFALKELLVEMDKQVYTDGANWEASIPYHALVTEIYLYAFLLAKENQIKIEDKYWNKLEKMFLFTRAYLKPDATAPLIGDCDNGRVILWQKRPATDQAYLLAIAATLFQDERFKILSQASQESLWIFGNFGWETLTSLPITEPPSSSNFPNTGIYLLRDKDLYLIADCGDIGIKGRGSHAHNDLLSFELFYRDRTFFIDPGSYVYTSDPTARNMFRSTSYHNTVMIDEQEINEIYPGQLFSLGSQAKPKVNQWKTTADFDFLEAQHDGYLRLSQGIIHKRQFLFNKITACWLITDLFEGSGEHLFNFFFNFDENLQVELIDNTSVIITDEENNLSLALVAIETKGMSAKIVERYVSKGYGEKTKSWAIVYNLRASAPEKRRFLIAPCGREDLSGIDILIEQIPDWKI
ncbi:MAG: alginate lyase family protein [Blastocatellia bacterium]|nr:alginate lyase family protein [Blastocatellia bacterium]MBN8722915.1 alginate lyase family protein [Acidobacteriota bacterium]